MIILQLDVYGGPPVEDHSVMKHPSNDIAGEDALSSLKGYVFRPVRSLDVRLFYADDSTDGRAFNLCCNWRRIAPDSARWEQALSADGGLTWIDHWFMDFTRVA